MILTLQSHSEFDANNQPIIKRARMDPTTKVIRWCGGSDLMYCKARDIRVWDSLMEMVLSPEVKGGLWTVLFVEA